MIFDDLLDYFFGKGFWQEAVSDIAGRQGADIRPRPDKAVQAVGNNPGRLLIKADTFFGRRGDFNRVTHIGRRCMGNRRHKNDEFSVLVFGIKDNGAWPGFGAFFMVPVGFIRPQKGIIDN